MLKFKQSKEIVTKISLSYILKKAAKALQSKDYVSPDKYNLNSNNVLVLDDVDKKALMLITNIVGKDFIITIREATKQEKYDKTAN